jgi:hypothetical protein
LSHARLQSQSHLELKEQSRNIVILISKYALGSWAPVAHAWHWWLTPIILATQEAGIRRITVWSQPGKIVHKTLSRKIPLQKRAAGVAKNIYILYIKYYVLYIIYYIDI